MEMKTVFALIKIIATYGIPAVESALLALNKTEVTQEDIDKLPSLMKKPEDY